MKVPGSIFYVIGNYQGKCQGTFFFCLLFSRLPYRMKGECRYSTETESILAGDGENHCEIKEK